MSRRVETRRTRAASQSRREPRAKRWMSRGLACVGKGGSALGPYDPPSPGMERLELPRTGGKGAAYLEDANQATGSYDDLTRRPAQEESREGPRERCPNGGVEIELESFSLSKGGVAPCSEEDSSVAEKGPGGEESGGEACCHAGSRGFGEGRPSLLGAELREASESQSRRNVPRSRCCDIAAAP